MVKKFSNVMPYLITLPILMAATFVAQAETGLLAKKYKIIIQASSGNPNTQNLALNIAENFQRLYGKNHSDIEIVAYGDGITLLRRNGRYAKRIRSMEKNHIRFSACEQSKNMWENDKNSTIKFVAGTNAVKMGIARVMELQELGYRYITP